MVQKDRDIDKLEIMDYWFSNWTEKEFQIQKMFDLGHPDEAKKILWEYIDRSGEINPIFAEITLTNLLLFEKTEEYREFEKWLKRNGYLDYFVFYPDKIKFKSEDIKTNLTYIREHISKLAYPEFISSVLFDYYFYLASTSYEFVSAFEGENFVSFLKTNRNKSGFHSSVVDSYLYLFKYTDLADGADAILSLYPDDVYALSALARLALMRGDFKKADYYLNIAEGDNGHTRRLLVIRSAYFYYQIISKKRLK